MPNPTINLAALSASVNKQTTAIANFMDQQVDVFTSDADTSQVYDAQGNVFTVPTWTAIQRNVGIGIVPIVMTATSVASVVPAGNTNVARLTALAVDTSIVNPSSTPPDGWMIQFWIKDNGTSHAIAFDTKYRGIGGTLPTATVPGKIMMFNGTWNAADNCYDIQLPVNQQS